MITCILWGIFFVGFTLTFSIVTIPVNGSHFGIISIASNIYTGGGNSSFSINKFDPINKEVYATETVQWTNPTAGKPYPHMVIFIGNQSSALIKLKISNISRILQSTDLQSVNFQSLISESKIKNANSNGGFDARSVIFPSLINSSGLNVSYLNPYGNWAHNGAIYNMTGKETYLNSGLIWNGRMVPKEFLNVTSFTVTFMNSGTYHYQCLIYPEMKGTITVKPYPEILGIRIK